MSGVLCRGRDCKTLTLLALQTDKAGEKRVDLVPNHGDVPTQLAEIKNSDCVVMLFKRFSDHRRLTMTFTT